MVVSQSMSRPEQFPQTRVSVKGQTVIPLAIRRLLNISQGSRLRWEVRGQVILVYPISQDPVGASLGVLKDLGVTLSDFLQAPNATNS